MVILDLCGGTGAWSKPYLDAGYNVAIIDPCEEHGMTVQDFWAWWVESNWDFGARVGVLAAPPCTEFAGSGARWWKDKPLHLLEEAIDTVRVCLRIIDKAKPQWWSLENPVGRLEECVPELGKWKCTFQPYEYGDPYTKRTCLWGDFNIPEKSPVEPTEGGKIWKMGPSPDRAKKRSVTPQGFAKAFFKANPLI